MSEFSGNACDRCGAMLVDAEMSLAVYRCPDCHLLFDGHLNRVSTPRYTVTRFTVGIE